MGDLFYKAADVLQAGGAAVLLSGIMMDSALPFVFGMAALCCGFLMDSFEKDGEGLGDSDN